MELVELGAKESADCTKCSRPVILPENEIVVTIYSCNPLIPIPMTDGIVMLDIEAVIKLMEVYQVEEKESVLERVVKLHNFMSRKGERSE